MTPEGKWSETISMAWHLPSADVSDTHININAVSLTITTCISFFHLHEERWIIDTRINYYHEDMLLLDYRENILTKWHPIERWDNQNLQNCPDMNEFTPVTPGTIIFISVPNRMVKRKERFYVSYTNSKTHIYNKTFLCTFLSLPFCH